MQLSPFPPDPGADRYVYDRLQVLRVVDGDTVVLRFPLPFNVLADLDVRLLGIDAPERVGASRAAGEAAKTYLAALLDSGDALRARSHKTDRYGRYLAELWLRRGGEWHNVSLLLLEAGHASPYDGGARR
ncbi:thermonuclease family protein [Deinococcus budaensis]|uniref:Endonuclease YncB(Thermonuclease family) n=1 Tax=Deinococcus budaensis TaxID=1665626 RepID=A0A7W8GFG0_9DEIO|nr:endonuclease YncB(thermonuclease family) [Deinococcus budaensis]